MFVIPSGLIQLYNDGIDSIIDFAGVDVVIVYPPKMSECPNCIFNTVTGRSSGKYKTGGPYPFTDNDICPYCEDAGVKFEEQSQTVKMLVYWEPKDFIRDQQGLRTILIDQTIQIPDNIIQTKCHMQHLPKVEKCNEIRVHSKVTPYKTWTYTRLKESIPHGFKNDNYILTYWKKK